MTDRVHACLQGKTEAICAPVRGALQRDALYGLGEQPVLTSLWSEVTCGWCRPLVEHVLEQGYVAVDGDGRLVATPGD